MIWRTVVRHFLFDIERFFQSCNFLSEFRRKAFIGNNDIKIGKVGKITILYFTKF